jgi:hypothetical protein
MPAAKSPQRGAQRVLMSHTCEVVPTATVSASLATAHVEMLTKSAVIIRMLDQ